MVFAVFDASSCPVPELANDLDPSEVGATLGSTLGSGRFICCWGVSLSPVCALMVSESLLPTGVPALSSGVVVLHSSLTLLCSFLKAPSDCPPFLPLDCSSSCPVVHGVNFAGSVLAGSPFSANSHCSLSRSCPPFPVGFSTLSSSDSSPSLS